MCLGQEISVQGYFIEDSIKIGVGTPYVLTASYPIELDVVFPDSLYDYSPYELGEKVFYPTASTSDTSYDSALYYITSFEIDSVQLFSLPIFQIVGGDSIKILAQQDSIILEHLVAEIPDSVAVEAMPLIENTTYRYVNLALNYPYLIIGVLIFIVLLVAGYLIFGKPIRKWFMIRKLTSKHQKYKVQFESFKSNSSNEKLTENISKLWKLYHEKLERRPYTKMTTRELLTFDHLQSIEKELRSIDRSLYGGKEQVDADVFNELLRFSENTFLDKVNEVKHG